jgi:hypothetical protein
MSDWRLSLLVGALLGELMLAIILVLADRTAYFHAVATRRLVLDYCQRPVVVAPVASRARSGLGYRTASPPELYPHVASTKPIQADASCRWNLGTTYRRQALFVCEGSARQPPIPDRAPS